jgi:hypothetical protein
MNRYTEIFEEIRNFEKTQKIATEQYSKGMLDCKNGVPPQQSYSNEYMLGYIKQYDLSKE